MTTSPPDSAPASAEVGPEPRSGPTQSLAEVHATVSIPDAAPWWRRWFLVAGPALMVSVGYMDPGNWATDLAGGSRYNYALIWVLLMSNLMAVLLQSLSARLGLVARRDLAQACNEAYPPVINLPLYLLAEVAITATDLAEVLGSAIALQLLFGLPLLYGVALTVFDVLLLLALSRYGIRRLEAVILALVGTIGAAFCLELVLAQPDWGGIASGFVPTLPDHGALYIAIGILGATVMPHNLYLHSSLVQTRRAAAGPEPLRRAIRLNTIDSAVSLNLAFFVNAAILVMAAAVFFRNGHHEVAEIQDAHRLLEPILGQKIAPFAFAIALLAAGQSSTITGTLAGQIVMEGYLNLRIRPWLRRLLTRGLAVIPAVIAILVFGESSTGGLLVLSQVILSLQLPFAVIPLLHFVADRRRMGHFAIGRVVQGFGWIVAATIVALNFKLVWDELGAWLGGGEGGGWAVALALPVTGGVVLLLVYVTLHPVIDRWRARERAPAPSMHPTTDSQPVQLVIPRPYAAIACALDFTGGESRLLGEVLRLAGQARPKVFLLHVVESAVAQALGEDAADRETVADVARLERCAAPLREAGLEVETRLGTGPPVAELVRLVDEVGADLVIVGAHGHRTVGDVLFGQTVDTLRHRLHATVVVVPV